MMAHESTIKCLVAHQSCACVYACVFALYYIIIILFNYLIFLTALWFVEYVKRLAELYAQVIDDKRCKSWKCLFRKSASTNKSKQM